MADSQFKVPEAVLDAFLGARTAGKTTGMSLAAACLVILGIWIWALG